MDRRDIADLLVFQAIVEAGSFTRAAARMGRAQSGLSQAVSALEARLGVPLLARSTRSVRPTEAGQRLLEQVAPALRQIESGLLDVRQERDRPSGTLRLTAMEYPARAILVPALTEFLASYPGVRVDIHVSDRFTDIVKGGFDAGIRFGTHLEKDMVAVPVGPDISAAIVAAPAYYARRGRPERLEDLEAHDCLNYRTASHGDLFRWMFRQGARTVEIPVKGSATFNDAPVMIEAALAGLGLAYAFEPHVAEHLASGRLETCLDQFCPVWSGYHLYYPSRHQKSAALSALVQLLRCRHLR
ncbi:LysR family transcriptional regulator [Alkalilimnicola ehrlichii]|uniref:LysR family transcriptional regulator n=1 Tax=Alkalilimnicola ehrlichii TaxID=351052 RepID=A0A3E0WMD5_9GAMM|nr:LysR family transcriptional regulator [Alkalilimnicola ehrlichii]RFA26242.1 LysR family transcriptional regulator [Alkalilimnicola ehrlichii]RFA33227.1 LysR family transcriptional regulator [Alkalilimnicola ehrlichii]